MRPIQHETGIGASEIIAPTLDDVERAGCRLSQLSADGECQHTAIVMAKSPTGLANAYDFASDPRVDGVIAGNNV